MSTPDRRRSLPDHLSAYSRLNSHHDKICGGGGNGVPRKALATAQKLGLFSSMISMSKAMREVAGMDGSDHLEVCSHEAMALMQRMYDAQAAAADGELHFHHSNRSGELLSATKVDASSKLVLLRLLLATAPNQGLMVPSDVNSAEKTALTYTLSCTQSSLDPSPMDPSVPYAICISKGKNAPPLADVEEERCTLERHVNNGLVDTLASWMDSKGRLATGSAAQQEIHRLLWSDTMLADWYTADEENLSRRPYVAAFCSQEAFQAVPPEAIQRYIQTSVEACRALEHLVKPYLAAIAAANAAADAANAEKRDMLRSVSMHATIAVAAQNPCQTPRKPTTFRSSKELYKVLKLYYDDGITNFTAVGKELMRDESFVRRLIQPKGVAQRLSRKEFLETIFEAEVEEVRAQPACMLRAALQKEGWDVDSLPAIFPESVAYAMKVLFAASPAVGGELVVSSELEDGSLPGAAAALPASEAAVALLPSQQLQLTGSAEGASCKGSRQGAEAGEEQTAGKCVEAAREAAVMAAAHANTAALGPLSEGDVGGSESTDVSTLVLPRTTVGGAAVEEEQQFMDVEDLRDALPFV